MPSSPIKLMECLRTYPFRVTALANAVLAILTLAVFVLLPRYDPTGSELLPNGTFRQNLYGWVLERGPGMITVLDGVVTLKSNVPQGFVSISKRIALQASASALQFRAKIASENIQRGQELGHNGRVQLILQGGTADDERQRFVLAELLGSHGWTDYSAIVPLDSDIDRIGVHIQLRETTGVLRASDLSLTALAERSNWHVASSALLVGWFFSFGWVGFSFLRILNGPAARGFAVIGMAVFLFALFAPNAVNNIFVDRETLSLPANILEPLLSLSDALGFEVVRPELLAVALLDGLGHFIVFFALALFVQHACPTVSVSNQIIWLSFFAGVTEVVQFFADDRQPDVLDWSTDVVAILTLHLTIAAMRKLNQ